MRVRVQGYQNIHDGYCSGNECEYEEIDEDRYIAADIEDDIDINHLNLDIFKRELRQLENDYIQDRTNQTFYCMNNPEAEQLGIEKHDVKVEFSLLNMDKVSI